MNSSRLLLALALSVCSLGSAGCEIGLLTAALADGDSEDIGYGGDQLQLETTNARLRGSLGNVVDFNEETTMNDAYVDYEWANISLWVEDGDSSVMVSLNAYGDSTTRMFTVGEEIDLGDDIDVIGCSGSDYGFEAVAEDGTVVVEESNEPGMVHLRFNVQFSDGAEIRGEADVAKPQ